MEIVGFVGIGAMGKGMIANLLEKGYRVHAFDTHPASLQWAVERGAVAEASPAEIGRSANIIFTSLPGPSTVKEVLLGPDGILHTLQPGSFLFDTSTIDPGTARLLYQAAKEQGSSFFDCPVSGGPAGAETGTLTIMVGGDEQQFSTILPYLQAIGKEILYMGESGTGQTAKLCHNAVVATITAVLGEVFAVGAKAGVSARKLAEVIDKGSAHNRVLSIFGPNMLNGSYDNVKFSLAHMHKDLHLYVNTANACDSPVFIGSTIFQLYETAKALGKGGLDSSAVCQVIETITNCDIARLSR
jgi:3-hydroxyisobutyrate dehydrogenase